MIMYSILSARHSPPIAFAPTCFYPHHNGMRIRMMQQYHRPPRKEGTAFVTGAVNGVLPPPSTGLHGKTVAALNI